MKLKCLQPFATFYTIPSILLSLIIYSSYYSYQSISMLIQNLEMSSSVFDFDFGPN